MRTIQQIICAAALALAGVVAGAVQAQNVATGDVNLRSGPGVGYTRITTIPRGAVVDVLSCLPKGWCDVVYGYERGWASGRYLRQTGPRIHAEYVYPYTLTGPSMYRIIRRTPVVVMVPQYDGRAVLSYPNNYPVVPYPQNGYFAGW